MALLSVSTQLCSDILAAQGCWARQGGQVVGQRVGRHANEPIYRVGGMHPAATDRHRLTPGLGRTAECCARAAPPLCQPCEVGNPGACCAVRAAGRQHLATQEMPYTPYVAATAGTVVVVRRSLSRPRREPTRWDAARRGVARRGSSRMRRKTLQVTALAVLRPTVRLCR